jgi:hypothetical protein
LLPYALIVKGSSYFESRYYYFTVVGVSLLLGIIVKFIINTKKIFLFIFLCITFLFFSVWHISYTLQDLSLQVQASQTRLSILRSIKYEIPKLKNKTIFYITGNGDYLLRGNPLPFQQGNGYTLLVFLYNPSIKGLNNLLSNNFLWDLGTEGYKQVGNNGFGFFYDYKRLKNAYLNKQFSLTDVYSFYWDSKENKLTSKTIEIRKDLLQ